ncbi:26S proteasome non-ATPase regulatory subunit 9-like [Oscarella lobularis]|uniref:26S proteasome non-ATPase regulatory subunit 9-like n=1 Tax=Oscarella lobularis TaxID=121494 RepID=UPI0033130E91
MAHSDVRDLIAQKDAIEAEIKALSDVLDSQKGVGMNEPLVDTEGFPRADIDIYSVRTARNKIIRLHNDHKSLMSQIERSLHAMHARERDDTDKNKDSEDDRNLGLRKPFLKVNLVSENSPASVCELKVGDCVLEFGSINAENFRSLQDVGELVKNSEGTKVWIKILRDGEEIRLGLIPKKWSGRGFLGCNIIPI